MMDFSIQKTNSVRRFKTITAMCTAVFLMVTLIILGYNQFQKFQLKDGTIAAPSYTPWTAIGGCGAGGGSKAGANIEWMGQGVSGGYLDVEFMPSYTSTPKIPGGSVVESEVVSSPLNLYYHLFPVTLGLTIPFQRIKSSKAPGTYNTTGMGDINLNISKPLGVENQFSLLAGLTLPTGRCDIYEDAEVGAGLISTAGQLGAGVVSFNLSLNMTKDKDWGFYLFGLEYSGGLLYRKGSEFSFDEELQRHNIEKRKWASARKDMFTYRNDWATVSSDNFGFKVIACIKQAPLHHSLHFKFSLPMALTNSAAMPNTDNTISESQVGSNSKDSALAFLRAIKDSTMNEDGTLKSYKYPYKEAEIVEEKIEESDGKKTWRYLYFEPASFKTWPTLTLGYGMEIFNPITPFYWAFSVPIEFDNENTFDVNGFSIQAGIKFVIF